MTRAVFLDRDGVIAEDKGYVHKIEDFRLVENAVEGLKLLKDFKLFIITNQSGIGRGFFRHEDFFNYNTRVINELKRHKIIIEKTYYCPHKPEDDCGCRKPKNKFVLEAAKEFGIELSKSFVIGDRKSDFELGKNSGCRTIHVLTGYGNTAKHEVKPDYFAENLLDAAKWILRNDKK